MKRIMGFILFILSEKKYATPLSRDVGALPFPSAVG